MARKTACFLCDLVCVLAILFLFQRTFFEAVRDSWDFEVYWKATRSWIFGLGNPYQIEGRSGFVFKYPPWSLPVFLPFAILPLFAAKTAWFITNWAGLAVCLRWLKNKGISYRFSVLCLICFWRFWISHFNAGQIGILLLAIALGLESRAPSWIPFFYSIKVFSLVTVLGLFRSKAQFFRLILTSALWVALGMISVGAVFKFHGMPFSFSGIFQDWVHASQSGNSELQGEVVRGAYNLGFPAFVLRRAHVGLTQAGGDVVVSLGVGIFLAFLWNFFSKNLPSEERWLGWIALGVVSHPLAWQHSFVLVFPLWTWVAYQAYLNRSGKTWLLVGVSWFLLDMRYPKTWSADQVSFFEGLSLKSFATALLAVSLVCNRRSGKIQKQALESPTLYSVKDIC